MSEIVYLKTYEAPAFDIKEAMRYAGVKGEDRDLENLMLECFNEAKSLLSYKVCFTRVPIQVNESVTGFPFFEVESKGLARNLATCSEAVLFAATVGIGLDRLISKYSRVSPSKGVCFQAIGAERIESLCNMFNEEIDAEAKESGMITRPRFSPGYGDFDLSYQKEMFRVLDCNRKIGLTLNESMLMSPSKSVTAIIGIAAAEESELREGADADAGCSRKPDAEHSCSTCEKTDCEFRR